MKLLQINTLAILVLLTLLGSAATANSPTAISLNNEAIIELNKGNWQQAINRLTEALRLDPKYAIARRNLDIAYNYFGKQLESTNEPRKALEVFRKAAFLNNGSWTSTTTQNIENVMRLIGKKTDSVDDRLALAEEAKAQGDFIGAYVEYSAALKLKNDPLSRKKLDEAYKAISQEDKDISAVNSPTE